MKHETAVLGGGCFWCTEALFRRLKGVHSVMPGYAGGTLKNPSYHEVTTGTTGHAEVIKIDFDPSIIRYSDLLDIFFHTHNPTSLNRQGNDVGTQYRSIILYSTPEQKIQAEEKIQELGAEFSEPIVTTVEPLTDFYDAEGYHKDYYEKNEYQPYCQVIIAPKVQKLMEKYKDKVEEPAKTS